MKTVWIRGGTVVDPSQGLECLADVVCVDGRVHEIVPHPTAEQTAFWAERADEILDADGCIVCPGFIDIHMHEDPYDPVTDRLEDTIAGAMLRMGVTTAVGGNCGENAAPPDLYLDAVDRQGAPVNLALLAGHTSLRQWAGGVDKYAPVDDETVERMVREGERWLEAGCVGVSFGVKYVPGTRWEEIVALATLCRRGNRMVSSHVRQDVEGVFDACRELADTGREAGVRVQFSHVGSMGGYGQMEELLEQIEGYRREGVDLMCDCYPYDAFSTGLGETTYDGENFARYNADYSHILLCDGPYAGQRCTKEIFDELRATRPETLTVGYFMRQADVDLALAAPFVMLGSDGTLAADGSGHPRAAGAFPRFLRQYAATGKLSLSEAVAKVTTMAAGRLGLTRKGSLKPGCDGDVVVFDLSRVTDRATYTDSLLPPEGIRWVLVGGEVAAREGEIVNGGLGRAVRL